MEPRTRVHAERAGLRTLELHVGIVSEAGEVIGSFGLDGRNALPPVRRSHTARVERGAPLLGQAGPRLCGVEGDCAMRVGNRDAASGDDV
ncbi:hypothetical protein EDF60_2766 [Leucobacter luti]|nr:hypothetical protein EDF60_2766 [Leucobacter luti]